MLASSSLSRKIIRAAFARAVLVNDALEMTWDKIRIPGAFVISKPNGIELTWLVKNEQQRTVFIPWDNVVSIQYEDQDA